MAGNVAKLPDICVANSAELVDRAVSFVADVFAAAVVNAAVGFKLFTDALVERRAGNRQILEGSQNETGGVSHNTARPVFDLASGETWSSPPNISNDSEASTVSD